MTAAVPVPSAALVLVLDAQDVELLRRALELSPFRDHAGWPTRRRLDTLTAALATATRISADAEVTPPAAETAPRLDVMTTSDVAALLGVTERRARQLAADLNGTLDDRGHWTFTRPYIDSYIESRYGDTPAPGST